MIDYVVPVILVEYYMRGVLLVVCLLGLSWKCRYAANEIEENLAVTNVET